MATGKPAESRGGGSLQPPAMPPLVPVIAQDATTGNVLMLAWANREAVARTLATGQAWYYSRSRRELWPKGATSGNTQQVVEAFVDCDQDAVLLRVNQTGPVCHTGNQTCFFAQLTPETVDGLAYRDVETGFLAELAEIVAQRDRDRPLGSYVASLLSDGEGLRPLQKVGEEAVEFAIAGAAMACGAAVSGDDPGAASARRERVVSEAADLLFHLLIALRSQHVQLAEVLLELKVRHNPKNEAPYGLETSPPGKT